MDRSGGQIIATSSVGKGTAMNLLTREYHPNGFKVLVVASAVLVVILSTMIEITLAQEATITPTLFKMNSLFEGDTCEPPCWFGLRPGESTSEDVYQFLSKNSSRFYNYLIKEGHTSDNLPIVAATLNLQPLKEGKAIDFFWQASSYKGNMTSNSSISFTDDLVSVMDIQPNVPISLNTTLQLLGEPDSLRAGISFNYDFILLYYPKSEMIVELTVSRDDDCKIANISQQFQVEIVSYLARPAYLERVRDILNGSDYIPKSIWESWITGGVNASCEDAIASLPSRKRK